MFEYKIYILLIFNVLRTPTFTKIIGAILMNNNLFFFLVIVLSTQSTLVVPIGVKIGVLRIEKR